MLFRSRRWGRLPKVKQAGGPGDGWELQAAARAGHHAAGTGQFGILLGLQQRWRYLVLCARRIFIYTHRRMAITAEDVCLETVLPIAEGFAVEEGTAPRCLEGGWVARGERSSACGSAPRKLGLLPFSVTTSDSPARSLPGRPACLLLLGTAAP